MYLYYAIIYENKKEVIFMAQTLDPFYSENNKKAIEESIKQMKEGKVVLKTMEELEKMENKQNNVYFYKNIQNVDILFYEN